MIGRRDQETAVFEADEAVVVDDVVSVLSKARNGIAEGLALVRRTHKVGHAKEVVSLHGLAEIQKPQVAVLHPHQTDRHDVEGVGILLDQDTAVIPGLALVGGIAGRDSGRGVVLPAIAVVLRVGVQDAPVLQTEQRSLPVAGILLAGAQEEHFLTDLFHEYLLIGESTPADSRVDCVGDPLAQPSYGFEDLHEGSRIRDGYVEIVCLIVYCTTNTVFCQQVMRRFRLLTGKLRSCGEYTAILFKKEMEIPPLSKRSCPLLRLPAKRERLFLWRETDALTFSIGNCSEHAYRTDNVPTW